MPVVAVAGHEVNFPFEPYGVQKAYMDRVIRSLQGCDSALLESPTGTGKTLSLLCSSLAWQKKFRESIVKSGANTIPPSSTLKEPHRKRRRHLEVVFGDPDPSCASSESGSGSDGRSQIPRIVYATRTHSQIAQVVKELRSTGYQPNMSILGGREQMCSHGAVKRSGNKNEDCKALLAENGCFLFCNVDRLTSAIKPGQVWDIEELVKLGKKHRACPFFAAKDLADDADIIFCPYNYVLDPTIRNSLGFKLNNAILIFDEAHNIEDVARESATCREDLRALSDVLTQMERMSSSSDLYAKYEPLNKIISSLVSWIQSAADSGLEMVSPDRRQKVFDDRQIASFFEEIGLDAVSFGAAKLLLEDMCEVSMTAKKGDARISSRSISMLTTIFTIFSFIFHENFLAIADYRILIEQYPARSEPGAGSTDTRWNTQWTMMCMNPAVAFRPLKGIVRSFILTSGTLSPIDSFASELEIDFKYVLEANHVVDMEKQVCVGALASGHGNIPMNCTFRNMQSADFQDAVGKTLLELCSVIPHGVLCFFPSYSAIADLKRRWKATKLWDELSQVKEVVEEPRKGESDFATGMSRYYAAVSKSQKTKMGGGLYLAVFRGKVSEGIDFADDNARGVILIGIPFPNVRDVAVNLKKMYNDKNTRSRNLLSGEKWYQLQAFRALNQAIGRCIRHRKDFGSIVFLDDRFTRPDFVSKLPKWVRGNFQSRSYPDMKATVSHFFQERALDAKMEADALAAQMRDLEESNSSVRPSSPCSSAQVPSTGSEILSLTGLSSSSSFGHAPSNTSPESLFAKKSVQLTLGSFVRASSIQISPPKVTDPCLPECRIETSPEQKSNFSRVPGTPTKAQHRSTLQFDTDPIVTEFDEDVSFFFQDEVETQVEAPEILKSKGNGMMCASCGMYIGKLQEHSQQETPPPNLQRLLHELAPNIQKRLGEKSELSILISPSATELKTCSFPIHFRQKQGVTSPNMHYSCCGGNGQDTIWCHEDEIAYKALGCPSCSCFLGLKIHAGTSAKVPFLGQALLLYEAFVLGAASPSLGDHGQNSDGGRRMGLGQAHAPTIPSIPNSNGQGVQSSFRPSPLSRSTIQSPQKGASHQGLSPTGGRLQVGPAVEQVVIPTSWRDLIASRARKRQSADDHDPII